MLTKLAFQLSVFLFLASSFAYAKQSFRRGVASADAELDPDGG